METIRRRIGILLGSILVPLFFRSTTAIWLDECQIALGMESGDISDESITASSSHAVIVGPQYARAHVNEKGGAWCSNGQMTADSREFLEIDLTSVHILTATGTQGRDADGVGQEYTEMYKLEYWRPGFVDFVIYKNDFGNETLPGNSNTIHEKKNVLFPPIIASKIRFIPFTVHPRTICLRVELYGCNHTTGLLQYSGVDGVLTIPSLRDDSYDGCTDGFLRDGIGQLYDGETGSNITDYDLIEIDLDKATHQGVEIPRGQPGSDCVGWLHQNGDHSPVELIFHFDTMRNFSLFVFHAFSATSKKFVLPTQAEMYFSDDGQTYESKPLLSAFNGDSSEAPKGRNISMDLRHRPGRVLKVLFYFPDGWFILSEVYFVSEICSCNVTDWRPTRVSPPAERTADKDQPRDSSTVSAVHANTRTYMGVVIGFVAGVFLLVATGLLVYVRRLRKKKSSPHVLKSPLSDSASVAFDMRSLRLATSYSGAGTSMYGPVSGPDEDGSLYHEPYKTPLFSASDYSVATIGRQFNEYTDAASATHKARPDGGYAVPVLSTPPPPFNAPYSTNGATPHSTNNNTPFSTTPISGPPTTPFTQASTLHSVASKFNGVVPCNSTAATLPLNGGFPSLIRICPPGPPPVPPPPENYLSPPQICTAMNNLSPFGTALYQLENGMTMRNRNPRELPRQAVNLAEKLGDGEFGTVYIGEVVNPTESESTTAVAPTGGGRQVIVASLHSEAPQEAKEIAWKQAQLMASLHDSNIESLLGVVSRGSPLLLVLENPTLGDLNQYLRRHVPDTTTPRLNHMRAISYGSLLYMATQISSGMKYLESHNIIHRDLATRNVLVGPGQLVKIGSVGSCRSLYAGDYYRIPTVDPNPICIPIRWMSWEAVFLGQFSSRSDVWSFGVTLWEILTLGRQQPFERLSDDGVIENLAHYHHDNNEQIVLTQPATCPKEMYDLLQECWRRSVNDRPNFRDIHLFLQRKNRGFSSDH